MLAQDFLAIDLNPYTWRNFDQIADIVLPGEKILYVLHDNKQIINVFHPGRGLVGDIKIDFSDLNQTAERIFSENGEIDSIQIIDKNSLIKYYTEVNASNFSDLDTDEYMSFINRLLHNSKGIDIFYRNSEFVDIFCKLGNYIKRNFPEDCTIVLCIFEEGFLSFDAILGFKNHKLVLMTSFDHFAADGFGYGITMQDFDITADIVRKRFGDPVQVYFFDKKDFDVKVNNFNKKNRT